MVQGSVRRISENSAALSPNEFYVALQRELKAAFTTDTAPSAATLRDIYVCERLSGYTRVSLDALIARMPQDVATLANLHTEGRPAVGAFEMQMIEFLLSTKVNRILSVVGRIGIGKSTFISYVLQNVRAECPSLQRFLPIILNGWHFVGKEPGPHQWIRVLKESIRARLESHGEVASLDTTLVRRILDQEVDTSTEFEGDSGSTAFIEVVRELQNTCGSSREPVIVFDNLDHLHLDTVLRITVLARSLHFNTGLCVITAMRPGMLIAQRERESAGGAFLNEFIELTAPDLRNVIRTRIKKAFKERKAVQASTPSGLGILFDDPEASVNSLANKVLQPRTQEAILGRLCGQNVRHALAVFEQFCRYRKLDYRLLLDLQVNAERPSDTLHRNWFDHFIDGIMVGDRECFKDAFGPISNIFFFHAEEHYVDYLILRWTLALLDWAGGNIERSILLEWLAALGYEDDLASAAILHLKARMLVEYSNSEDTFMRGTNVALSEIGKFYIRELASHPQYLKNAVFDIPLRHLEWRERPDESFADVLGSIGEFLDVVYERESVQVQRVQKIEAPPAVYGTMKSVGFLTEQLVSAAKVLAAGGAKAPSDRTKDQARKLSEQLNAVAAKIAALRVELLALMTQRELALPTPAIRDTLEAVLSEPNSVKLTVPRVIGPAEKNLVSIEAGLPDHYTDLPIVALWRGQGDRGELHQEMIQLKWKPADGKFTGEFVVSDVDALARFPASTVTIFADASPVLVTRLEN
jgi:hypothetical protein